MSSDQARLVAASKLPCGLTTGCSSSRLRATPVSFLCCKFWLTDSVNRASLPLIPRLAWMPRMAEAEGRILVAVRPRAFSKVQDTAGGTTY